MIFEQSSQSVGNTPLVRLGRLARGLPAEIVAKVESRNPTGSVKCRLGLALIESAEARGILKRGSRAVTVVEPTSGNTGIALAAVCAARGYKLILTMPETMSLERRRILQAYGAELVLTPGEKGMAGSIEAAKAMKAADPDHIYIPQQFENPANPEIHYKTTGPEIWEACDGVVDVFVAAVGTGGTFTGTTRYLKEMSERAMGISNLCAVAVEPAGSPVLTQLRNGEIPKPGPHKIQGIGAGFKPRTLEMHLIDKIETVSDEEAFEVTRRLHKEEGLFCGISSGAAVAAALRYAQDPARAGQRVVVILPDTGERYLSSELFK